MLNQSCMELQIASTSLSDLYWRTGKKGWANSNTSWLCYLPATGQQYDLAAFANEAIVAIHEYLQAIKHPVTQPAIFDAVRARNRALKNAGISLLPDVDTTYKYHLAVLANGFYFGWDHIQKVCNVPWFEFERIYSILTGDGVVNTNPNETKRIDHSRFPSKCQKCGGRVYIGLNIVEHESGQCGAHLVGEDDEIPF